MSWTKRQLVTQAFEEIGGAGYVFDLEPEQLQSALRKLDSMMGQWYAKGIKLGYPIPTSPQDSSLDEESNIPDDAPEGVYSNLAIRLGPGIGKLVSADTKAIAKVAYDTLLIVAATPQEMQFPSTLPLGSGNKPRGDDRVFMPRPNEDPLQIGNNGQLKFLDK